MSQLLYFFEFVETPKIKQFANSYGLNREDLPQIHSADIPDFLDFIKGKGVKVEEKTVRVSELKPTQKEYLVNKAKVKLAGFQSGEEKPKVFLVSADGFIMDSHHQLVAMQIEDENQRVKILQADVKVDKMLELARSYPKTVFKKIHEKIMKNLKTRDQLLEAAKDSKTTKDVWWDKHYQALIDAASDMDEDDWLAYFDDDQDAVDATMDSTGKHKALTLLSMLNIKELNDIIGTGRASSEDAAWDRNHKKFSESLALKKGDSVKISSTEFTKPGKVYKVKKVTADLGKYTTHFYVEGLSVGFPIIEIVELNGKKIKFEHKFD